MLNPRTFHPRERTLSPPEGMHEEVSCLRIVDVIYSDGTQAVVSCWEITDEDLEKITRERRIFVAAMGNTQPPILLTPDAYEVGVEVAGEDP